MSKSIEFAFDPRLNVLNLERIIDGQYQIAEVYFRNYLENMPKELTLLNNSVNIGDCQAVTFAVHSIFHMLSQVGLDLIITNLNQIKNYVQIGEIDKAKEFISSLISVEEENRDIIRRQHQKLIQHLSSQPNEIKHM